MRRLATIRAWPLGTWASDRIRESIEASLARLGVRFDVWKSEGSLHTDGWVDRGVAKLRDAGYLYEQDGATWFRSTDFGDDKDRVVYRSNGAPTYFASDIGYLLDKFSRGFDELIYIWGADHHGTVARNRAAAQALGFDAQNVQWLLIAWVRFIRGGEEMSMSKRSGEFITLDELLEEIGVDAARWFIGSRGASVGIDFDIELAKQQSNENPVYYVQYAHARSASILRHAAERSLAPDTSRAAELLTHRAEQALIRRLLALPDVVADAAARRETQDLPRYCYEVASLYSQFYRDCRVLSDEPREAPVSAARLALVDATRQVLRNGLGLMGISRARRDVEVRPPSGRRHEGLERVLRRGLQHQQLVIAEAQQALRNREVDRCIRLANCVGVGGRIPPQTPGQGEGAAWPRGDRQPIPAPACRRCAVSADDPSALSVMPIMASPHVVASTCRQPAPSAAAGSGVVTCIGASLAVYLSGCMTCSVDAGSLLRNASSTRA